MSNDSPAKLGFAAPFRRDQHLPVILYHLSLHHLSITPTYYTRLLGMIQEDTHDYDAEAETKALCEEIHAFHKKHPQIQTGHLSNLVDGTPADDLFSAADNKDPAACVDRQFHTFIYASPRNAIDQCRQKQRNVHVKKLLDELQKAETCLHNLVPITSLPGYPGLDSRSIFISRFGAYLT